MRGLGTQCDMCHVNIVTEGDHYMQRGGRVPDGWYIVIGPMSGAIEVSQIEQHFCSIECTRRALV